MMMFCPLDPRNDTVTLPFFSAAFAIAPMIPYYFRHRSADFFAANK
jgi:hypothetical protein